jgi:hypothetical protein
MDQPTTLEPPPTAPPDAPDWDAVRDEIRCPPCGYQLRGLTEPRCPECGYRFEWRPLLDPTARLHPFVFEHHPRRNLWSFVRTMLGTLLPRRFWRSLHPAQPSRPRRLVLYWALAALLCFTVPVALTGRRLYRDIDEAETNRARTITALKAALAKPTQQWSSYFAEDVERAGGPQAYLAQWETPPARSLHFVAQWLRWRRDDYASLMAVPVLYVAWPWLTLATLLLFAASMRRAKVRTVHVLRCVLYSSDAGVWIVPLATLGAFALLHRVPRFGLLDGQVVLLLVTPMFAAYTAYRLSAAYQLYLRFDRPFATALAAQFVVALAVFVAILNVPPI